MKNETQGVTLIALVVTIIVLIILAVVSINLVIGENGLISQAEKSAESQANAEVQTKRTLDTYSNYISEKIDNTQVEYTIIYDANGGTGTMENTTGTTVIVASNGFTGPSSKEFKEWNTKSDGTGTIYKAGDELNKNVTLYAIWQYATCCFDAGSKVLMADRTTKNIENIKEGDMVISLDETTGEFITQRVINLVIRHESDDLVYINLSNGVQIGMRAYHPLLTIEGWKSLRPELAQTTMEVGNNVELLQVGDTLIGYDNNPTIVSIKERDYIEHYDTYNLSVDGCHNYIINGIVAHNSGNVEQPNLWSNPCDNSR